MSGAIIYTVMSPGVPEDGYSFGFAFVLAWLAFPLTLISSLIYIILRKKEWRISGEMPAVITENDTQSTDPNGLFSLARITMCAKCVIKQKWQIMKIKLNDDSVSMSLWLWYYLYHFYIGVCTYECRILVDEGPYFEADHKKDRITIFILLCLILYPIEVHLWNPISQRLYDEIVLIFMW